MKSDILEKVLAYIDEHIYEKINLCVLAELAGYSPFYFSKLFSDAMGMPVTGYIRIRKLQYAIVSLLEGRKVLEVAILYAFDSHEGFTRAFTQLFGSTPSTVRKHLTSYAVPKYVVPVTINGRSNMEAISSLQHNMHQLAFEFLEQSIEEAKAGFCTNIEITLLSECRIKINDNGRGLPLSEDLHASKAVLDKILAGSPITNAEYSQMGDLIQAGLQTVNSLCEALQIIVKRDGEIFQQDYIRGIAQHELYTNKLEGPSGTEIILKPDTSIFGKEDFSLEILNEWVKQKRRVIDNIKIDVKSING
ncbi:helix-turn-helix domain-containing protein [Anaerocolumna jejuensis]|uniref:helix-turn-helix domain-containing protein n=1 Tax=Anaerocolumna jejuensis TaxID=259063 RepID=UPI003F7BF4BD